MIFRNKVYLTIGNKFMEESKVTLTLIVFDRRKRLLKKFAEWR